MPLKPIYELETTTEINGDHTLLVYQDKRLKKIDPKDLFYSNEYIKNNIETPKTDIIHALSNLNVSVPDDSTLHDLINYADNIDLFEIGVRRLIHDGTDTREFTGTPSVTNNPNYVSMGVPQSSPILERCYKIGGLLTVIPTINEPDPSKDLIYANMSTETTMVRNDFYGGDYSSEKWKSGIYPWNSMEKIMDEHGNYFTKVPLYFIKEEFVTDTGFDISASWPIIPDKFINNIIYKYTFVCKTRLPGYRPAEFFYDHKQYQMIEDNEGEYIYLKDLECYTIPLSYGTNETRYSLSDIHTNKNIYTKILTRNHYFGCYEASTETNGIIKTITSKPGTFLVSADISEHREYCKNTDNLYFVRDIRSYTDFFCTLFTIEFATTNSKLIANGSYSYSSNNNKTTVTILEDAQNTNTIKTNFYFDINTYISIFTDYGTGRFMNRKILSVNDNDDGTYNITFDGDPVTVYTNYKVLPYEYPSGLTDKIPFRSACHTPNMFSQLPFKWNWIENVYGNYAKYLDGGYIKHVIDSDNYIRNYIYVSNNTNLYDYNSNNAYNTYNKLSYMLPTSYNSYNIDGWTGSTVIRGKTTQLGYDNSYPWCQFPSKITDDNLENVYYSCEIDIYNGSLNDSCHPILMGEYIFNTVSLYTLRFPAVLTYGYNAALQANVVIQKIGK